MLLAIDAGNTQTVYGVWNGREWVGQWRRATDAEETEDQIAAWLRSMFESAGIPFAADRIVCASVVPPLNGALLALGRKWLGTETLMLERGTDCGLVVRYDPPHSVGADRLANALGALALAPPPIVVVDFGTATTFDVIDSNGAYQGGAILPGVAISAQALALRTAKLPQIEFKAPDRAIGRNTVESLQSGLVLGYVGAIDSLTRRIRQELGGHATVMATGGLGEPFAEWCEEIQSYQPTLTLDGLRIASDRLATK